MRVTLRHKKGRNGIDSLYLDYHQDGIRTREYLKLQVFSEPISPKEMMHNKEMLELAETVRGKRQYEIAVNAHGIKKRKKGGDFLEFFKSLMDERSESKSNFDNWNGTYKHLLKFSQERKEKLTIPQIDEEWLTSFKNYLLKELAQNSAFSYFNKVRAALNTAFERRLIDENPVIRVKRIRQAETKREYLTHEELKRLTNVDCKYPVLKQAFLFSALTGIRWSDIQKFTWSELQQTNRGGYIIHFKQKKTDGVEYLPISQKAFELLGPKEGPEDKVFKGLKYSAYHNIELAKWVMRADIKKDITFHCARHTFATLQLSFGTDIYTVSKLLGHRELKTTQVYAKIVDSLKEDAVNRIPDIF